MIYREAITSKNIKITEISDGEIREKGTENVFKEIIAEKFSNLGKELDIQVYEANGTLLLPQCQNPSLRHNKTQK